MSENEEIIFDPLGELQKYSEEISEALKELEESHELHTPGDL